MSQWAGPATVRSHCGGSDERTSAAYCPHCKGEQLRTTPALVAAVHPPACLPEHGGRGRADGAAEEIVDDVGGEESAARLRSRTASPKPSSTRSRSTWPSMKAGPKPSQPSVRTADAPRACCLPTRASNFYYGRQSAASFTDEPTNLVHVEIGVSVVCHHLRERAGTSTPRHRPCREIRRSAHLREPLGRTALSVEHLVGSRICVRHRAFPFPVLRPQPIVRELSTLCYSDLVTVTPDVRLRTTGN